MQRTAKNSLYNDSLDMLDEYFDTTQWDAILIFLVLSLNEWEKNRPKPKKADEQEKETAEADTAISTSVTKAKSYVPPWKDLEKFLEQQAKYYDHFNVKQQAETSSRNTSVTRNQSAIGREVRMKRMTRKSHHVYYAKALTPFSNAANGYQK